MFNHIEFGATNSSTSRAFFLKALDPVGAAIASEGPPSFGIDFLPQASPPSASSKPPKHPPTSTWPSKPKPASRSTPSIAQLFKPAPKTTAHPAYARITTPTTTPPSSSALMATTSKSFAMSLSPKPRPNLPLHQIPDPLPAKADEMLGCR